MSGADFGDKATRVGRGRLVDRMTHRRGVLYKVDMSEVKMEAVQGSLLILLSASTAILCVVVEQIGKQLLIETYKDLQTIKKENAWNTADLYKALMNREDIHCISNDRLQNIFDPESWNLWDGEGSKKEVLRNAITSDVCVIHGPPGTGKTSVAVQIIH